MQKRGSGVLLHITSFPSSYGIGDLGPAACEFVDFLIKTKQSFWQIVPLNPTTIGGGNNPYNSLSAFAGNTLLISPEVLVKEGLLNEEDIKNPPQFREDYCEYEKVVPYKEKLFNTAYERFKKTKADKDKFKKFCSDNSHWLEDFTLFVAIKHGQTERPWHEWPPELKDRKHKALQGAKKKYAEDIGKEKFLQYLFFKQWQALKWRCYASGIQIIGDIPIYVSYDSVDVWTQPEIFKLDKNKKPVFVSGVPPDYFSATGQLWGNPVYDWDAIQKTGYKWWIDRIEHNLGLVDILRVDHFRGLVAYWEVVAGEKTAINGRWVKAPVASFLNTLRDSFPELPILAEDLGIITDDVREVMRRFNLPGMRVLLFAFGEDNPEHPYLPHNYVKNCAAYTGTHDNNTARGWFDTETSAEDKKRLFNYIGREVSANEVHWELIRLVMESVANTAVFPMQDILGLGKETRLNTPSSATGNYRWRLSKKEITPEVIQKLLDATKRYGRERELPASTKNSG